MKLEEFIKAINYTHKRLDNNYCLNNMTNILTNIKDKTKIVKFNNNNVGKLHLFRGDNYNLSLEYDSKTSTTVEQLLNDLKSKINTKMTGYKGNERIIDGSDAVLYVANYGDSGCYEYEYYDYQSHRIIITGFTEENDFVKVDHWVVLEN